jgi:hypothetical protein
MIVAAFSPIVDAAEECSRPAVQDRWTYLRLFNILLMASGPEGGIEAYQHP